MVFFVLFRRTIGVCLTKSGGQQQVFNKSIESLNGWRNKSFLLGCSVDLAFGELGDLTAPPLLNGFPCKPSSEVISEDFFFDGLSKEGNTSNALGSSVAVGNVLVFPGVNTLGISMNRVDIAAGGLNPPHVHPRATESGFVVEGRVLVGLITTGNVFYSKVLSAGQMFVIPRGLVHFQMNVGEGKALLVTAFNSQLPGALIVASNLFGSTPPVPDEVLAKAFQVEESVVADIKGKFGA